MSDLRPGASARQLVLLGEYRGLLFVDKPAGLQTEPDARHQDTLVTRLAAQLARRPAEIHALSRLDTAVSGVVTLGLTSAARRLVGGWRERGQFRRRYLALATGHAPAPIGVWVESIGRAAGSLRAVGGRNPETAYTEYALISSTEPLAHANQQQLHLLALAPRTGRTHQLRVHSAAHGLPLLGDRAYGGLTRLVSDVGTVRSLDRVALHAAWVELPLPEPRRIEAAIPAELLEIWRQFGGDTTAFAAGLGASLGS